MPTPHSPLYRRPKMELDSKYECVLCQAMELGSEFPRKSKSGSFPPICSLCRQRRSKEVKNVLALDGKFGPKRKTAARMIKNPTQGELAMASILRNAKLKFKPQVVLLGFIADFHLCKRGIIVEVDGAYHLVGDQVDYDRGRDIIFRDYGYRTVRVTNEEAINEPDKCLQRIREVLEIGRAHV